MKNLLKCQKNDYTTGNLLDFLYHQNYYKLIGIDSSRQTNGNILQQINFVGKLEQDDGATIFVVERGSIIDFSVRGFWLFFRSGFEF